MFFPPAEFLVTTRISKVDKHSFQTNGKVLVKPGWLAVYGKDVDEEESGSLVPVQPNEVVRTESVDVRACRPNRRRRYTEATCSRPWKARAS